MIKCPLNYYTHKSGKNKKDLILFFLCIKKSGKKKKDLILKIRQKKKNMLRSNTLNVKLVRVDNFTLIEYHFNLISSKCIFLAKLIQSLELFLHFFSAKL